MVLESKKNKNIVNEEVQFNLDGDDELVVHKVQFDDLVKIPKYKLSANPHKKLLTTHLLMSLENQKKTKEADEAARKK